MPRQLDRETQIGFVTKLLLQGEDKINVMSQRIAKGKGLVAKGISFDVDVLRAAMERVEAQQRPAPPSAPAPAPESRTPRKRKPASADENRKPSTDNAKPDVDAPKSPDRTAKAPKASPKAARTPRSAKRRRSGAAASEVFPPGDGLSVRELKARLFEQGLDCAGCVEKADLQALWDRFETWRARPLEELQDLCQAEGGLRFDSADECAKYLAESKQRRAAQAAQASAPARAEPQVQAADREQDALKEVQRILPLKRESFVNPTAWGFAVLGVPTTTREVAAVQRAYRACMKKLHPDRAGQSQDLLKAVEKVREAKEACERGLSRQEPPSAPRAVRSETLCATPGKRKYQLCWTAPPPREFAPVRRYVVAAFDPAYGKALTVTVLEPDYSQELRSFVAIENLTSYVMAEEDLQKMPKLWTQSVLTVQVAAANEAGQSPWTTHKISLNAPAGSFAGKVSEPFMPAFPKPPSPPAPSFSSAAAARNLKPSTPDDAEVASFNLELRKLRGSAKLRAFLEPLRKGILQAWLRSVNWSAAGSKQDLVERVIFIREAMVA